MLSSVGDEAERRNDHSAPGVRPSIPSRHTALRAIIRRRYLPAICRVFSNRHLPIRNAPNPRALNETPHPNRQKKPALLRSPVSAAELQPRASSIQNLIAEAKNQNSL